MSNADSKIKMRTISFDHCAYAWLIAEDWESGDRKNAKLRLQLLNRWDLAIVFMHIKDECDDLIADAIQELILEYADDHRRKNKELEGG